MSILEEQLTAIVEKEQSETIIPFLEKLTAEERKVLIPCLSRLEEYYNKIVQCGERTYGIRATLGQCRILELAALVLFPLKEFRKYNWGIHVERLKELLPRYIPSWLDRFYKENEGKAFGGFYHLDYETLMDWREQGVLTVAPSPESIAGYLTPCMNHLDILLKREITLKEHIWYLFQYDCGQYRADGEKDGEPYHSFRYLIEHGYLDRMRVLRESLAAVNRNLNKNLCGWFAGMFSALQTGEEEQLALQTEMFSVLSCPHSRPVNMILGFFEKLCSHPGFRAEEFPGYASVLFSLGVKAVARKTLTILDKLAKERPELRTVVCCAAVPGLMSADETVRQKVIKLIQTYGNKNSDELKEVLAQYKEMMSSSAKKELGDYLEHSPSPADENPKTEEASCEPPVLEEQIPSAIREDNRIPEITSPEDLVFLASQVLDVNEVYHFDQLIGTLIQWNGKMQADHLPLWTSVFQRACKLLMEGSSRAGHVDYLMATFLTDYTRLLLNRFPDGENELKSLYGRMVKKDEEQKGKWKFCNLRSLTVRSKAENCAVHRQLLCRALELLENNKQELPLLSTPTHTPAYIDPAVLIQRFKQYRQAKAEPDNIDIQVALLRVALDGASSVLPLLLQEPESEYKRLLLFLFGEQDAIPQPPFDHPAWWMTAGLIKSPETVYPAFKDFSYHKGPREYLTGNFPWKTFREAHSYTDYGNQVTEWTSHTLGFDLPEGENVKIFHKGEYDERIVYYSCGSSPLVAEMFVNAYHDYNMRNDLMRTLWLSPNAPETILVNCIRHAMFDPRLGEVAETVVTQTAMEVFHGLRHTWHEISYLLEATAMLAADKTARIYAAEVWIDRVRRRCIDSARVGKILGMHQCTGWGPLKRLIELLQQQMMNVSPLHNRELERLLTAMLAELPEQPVKELKKLLEIYAELLAVNRSNVTDNRVRSLLEKWEEVANLKKVVRVIRS